MNGNILIIAGHLAAGKSTLARRLSAELSVPCLIKDDVKETLCDCVGAGTRAENKRLSAAAVAVMFDTAQTLCLCGFPLILEANFRPREAARLNEIAAQTGGNLLTYMLTGDPQTLYGRFQTRQASAERHKAHKSFDFPDFAAFRASNEELAAFKPSGQIIQIDATDPLKIDYAALIRQSKAFLAH